MLTQCLPIKLALLEQSWLHIPPLRAIASQLVIGSPYHNSLSCAMRASGRTPWPSKGFASSMKRMAGQSLASLTQVTSFRSGDQFAMLGRPTPFLLLRFLVKPPNPSHKLSRQARCSANAAQLAHVAGAHLIPVLANENTSLQSCALLCIRRHENDSLTSHTRL